MCDSSANTDSQSWSCYFEILVPDSKAFTEELCEKCCSLCPSKISALFNDKWIKGL
jgi:hypothetical protein